jgi:DNA-binding HxlR family transcriptional regulator
MSDTWPPLHACHYTEEVFALLGKRWTGLLIDLLLQRPARFNELAAAVPQLSRRVLTERLAELQDAGLATREVEPGPPVAVTYRLTDKGAGLGPAMDALRVWAGAPTDENGRPLPLTAAEHGTA